MVRRYDCAAHPSLRFISKLGEYCSRVEIGMGPEEGNIPGPKPPATAHVRPTKPRYTPLFLTENMSLIQMLTKMRVPPPPMPCTARPTRSIGMFTLAPQRSEPIQKIPTAVNSTGFRPKMSDILPHDGAAAALANR